jgi:hypothetical protein
VTIAALNGRAGSGIGCCMGERLTSPGSRPRHSGHAPDARAPAEQSPAGLDRLAGRNRAADRSRPRVD